MKLDEQAYRAAEDKLWASLNVAPTERWVQMGAGNRVRVQEVGAGRPMVFLHGAAIGGTSWCQLAAGLTGIRAILVDRPGCGLSDPIPGGPLRNLAALQRYADWFLGDLLDALELDAAAVGATSYGGFFALRGAARVPQRVTKLVQYSWLVGAPSALAPLPARLAAIPGAQAMSSRVPMTRPAVKLALGQFGLKKAIASGAFNDDMLDWAYAVLRYTPTLLNDTASSPKLFLPLKGQNTEVLLDDELLNQLGMPSLFIWGSDDPNGGTEIAQQFVERVPNSRLALVQGAEHAPWIDDLDQCVAETQAFVLSP